MPMAAINRAKTVLSSLRFPNSLQSTRRPVNDSLHSKVTNLFSDISPSVSRLPQISIFRISQQKLYSSSQQSYIVDHILDNNWSEILELQLSNANTKLTHETVVYILKKIDKDPEKASNFYKWVSATDWFSPSSTIYGLLLRIFANKESIEQFWATSLKMKEDGVCIDWMAFTDILGAFRSSKMETDATEWTKFYNKMVKEIEGDEKIKKVVEVVTRSDWNSEVERALGEMEIAISDHFIVTVLKELKKYPMKALKFFRWVGGSSRYEHNSVTYNRVARVLGHSDSIGVFWDMIKEMKSLGYEMDIDTYIKISRQFQKNKMFKDEVELYELMMDGPFKPSVQHCGVLLRNIALSSNPDMDLVFRVVKKHEEAGNLLTKTDYDGIHRSLTRAGRFDEADEIVEAMKNAGYEPDNITYSQLISGLCRAKRLEDASNVLDVMEDSGCTPDIKTWTILISGYCNANQLDGALVILAKMVEKNCEVDGDLLDVLMNGFLNQNRIHGAYTLLVEMVKNTRLRPWQATYKNLIQKVLDARKFEEALNLLHLVKKHNYPPFPEPFLQYVSKFGTVEDAGEFLNALSGKENPSVAAYVHVFESFFKEGRHSEANDLLYKSPYHVRRHEAVCKLFGSASSNRSSSPSPEHGKNPQPLQFCK